MKTKKPTIYIYINIKISNIMKPKNISTYEIYKSYFPDLELKTFITLEYNGMLGKLFRGEEVKLISEDIFIKKCWWRYETFKQTNQYVPCVLKEVNPYWK